MKVSFTPDAKQSVRDKRAWWVKHRDKAPRLFRDELRAVIAKIRSGEDEGKQEYTVLRGRVIWRLLMPKNEKLRLLPRPRRRRSRTASGVERDQRYAAGRFFFLAADRPSARARASALASSRSRS